ncbi:hypothetical protein BGX34_006121 [Mortierella sp. NVP85]|nr:hypothetical protein BGX34_006121 [Mortierella sp. NVP85]
MAAAAQSSQNNTHFDTKYSKATSAAIPITARYQSAGKLTSSPGSTSPSSPQSRSPRPSSPRLHNHQPYSNHLRSLTSINTSKNSKLPSTALSKPSPSSSGTNSSRAGSILDGIQSAIGGLSGSSPPKSSSTTKSSYSAARESLADFSIGPSKRSSTFHGTTSSSNEKGEPSRLGIVRSRSNYVSFPSFDDIDFVDVAMVDDLEEEEDDDHPDWRGPDSPPEGQEATMSGHPQQGMDEKLVKSNPMDPRLSLAMPTSPSQHWLLQLETYHELRVNGVQV